MDDLYLAAAAMAGVATTVAALNKRTVSRADWIVATLSGLVCGVLLAGLMVDLLQWATPFDIRPGPKLAMAAAYLIGLLGYHLAVSIRQITAILVEALRSRLVGRNRCDPEDEP